MCHIVKRLSLFGSSFTLLFLATIAEAQQYQFTKIGDHVYSDLGAPSINDHGLVAYETQRLIDGKNYYVVEAGDGHSLKTIAAASPFTGYINPFTSVNDAGTVAFIARDLDGQDGLFTGNGGPVRYLASDFNSDNNGPSINNAGQVAYYDIRGSGDYGVYVTDGSSVQTIARSFSAGGNIYNNVYGGVINDAGTVVFGAAPIYFGNDYNIYTNSNGITTLAVESDQYMLNNSPFTGFGYPTISEDGTIAFFAKLLSGEQGVYTFHNGVITTIADSNGPFSVFDGDYIVVNPNGNGVINFKTAINHKGEVAFGAALKNGKYGIFTGPDPFANRVVSGGDVIDGQIVRDLSFDTAGYNDNGQIAFEVSFENGDTAIYRADPVPEPSVLVLPFASVLAGVAFLRRRTRYTCRHLTNPTAVSNS